MGFPIKKRITCIRTDNYGPAHSGLDLLSAVIDSRPLHAQPAAGSSPEGMIVSAFLMTTAEECSSSDNEDSSSVHSSPKVAAQAEANSCSKRAKTFPEILMEILSNPDYVPIVSWLPHGKCFAIHNPSQFSSQILPKYFRRVIFRSFIRKLNRWGFRSVKRSVSGFESTFDHKYFCRDQPEMCARMYCKSNPTSTKAASKSSTTDTKKAAISRTNSMASTASVTAQVPQAVSPQAVSPQAVSPQGVSNMNSISHNEEFRIQFENELILREMQHQRQQALMQLVHQMPMVDADIVSQYVAEKWQLLLSQQRGSAEYGAASL